MDWFAGRGLSVAWCKISGKKSSLPSKWNYFVIDLKKKKVRDLSFAFFRIYFWGCKTVVNCKILKKPQNLAMLVQGFLLLLWGCDMACEKTGLCPLRLPTSLWGRFSPSLALTNQLTGLCWTGWCCFLLGNLFCWLTGSKFSLFSEELLEKKVSLLW